MMKDKQNIILILVLPSSKRFQFFFRSGSRYQFFSQVFLSFLFRSSKFIKYLFVKLHLNLGKVIILFFSTFISLHHSFVYGGPSWWFVKVSIHSQVFFKILVGEPQVSFLLHFYVQLFFLYPLRWYYSILVSVGASKSFPFKNEIIKSINSVIMRYFQPMISSLSYLGLDFT